MATPSTYIRVDSALGTNAKFQEADDDLWLACVGLYVLVLGWCDLNSTDGRTTRRYVTGKRGIAPGSDDVLDEVIRVGLIDEEEEGHLFVRDFLEWQRSAEEKRAASEKARRAAAARFAPKDARRNAPSNASSNAFSNAEREIEREIDKPSPPTPPQVGGEEVAAVRRASGSNTVTTKAARAVIGEFGYEVALKAARSLVENVPPGGVRSPDALFRRRAADMEPPPPPLPKRQKCDTCGGSGVTLNEAGDAAVKCPKCEGRGCE